MISALRQYGWSLLPTMTAEHVSSFWTAREEGLRSRPSRTPPGPRLLHRSPRGMGRHLHSASLLQPEAHRAVEDSGLLTVRPLITDPSFPLVRGKVAHR